MPAIRPAPRNTDFETPSVGESDFGDYAGSLVYDSLYHSPISGVYRMTEAAIEKYDGDGGQKISPQDANKIYGLDGELNFTEPVYEGYANLLHDRKIAELRRNYELMSGSQDHWGRKISGFGVSLVSQIIDPVNLASMFLPVVGESKFLQGLERSGGFLRQGLISPKTLAQIAGTSALRYRLAKGALEGAVGTALVEPFNAIPAIQEQADYNWKDSVTNIAFGSIMGGLLHAGTGWLSDKFKSLHQSLREIEPETHQAAVTAAVHDIVQDQPVTSPADIVSVDHRVVQAEQQEVNVQDLFNIANEHLDRLEQLYLQGTITPAQDMRRKILGAMLRNPNSATPENLAAMFELKLNNDATKMPGAYNFVNPESLVKAPEGPVKPQPVPFDRMRYQFKLNEIHSVGAGLESDDMLPHEFIQDHPNEFENLIKKLQKQGYDVINPQTQVKMGGQAIVFLTPEGKAVKVTMEKYKTIPGLNLVPEYQTKVGPFFARVVDKVTPMSEHTESPAIREAMQLLASRYGLSADDLGHWNLGIKDGRLVILDEGAMGKIDKANPKLDVTGASPEAQAVYNQLLKQIDEQKQKVQQRTTDKVKQIMDQRAQAEKKPEQVKVPTDKEVGLAKPIPEKPEPMTHTTLPQEELDEAQKMLADLQKETDDLEKEVAPEEDHPVVKAANEKIAVAKKLGQAIEAGTQCIVKKAI